MEESGKKHQGFIDFKGKRLIVNARLAIGLPKSFPNRRYLIEMAMNEMYEYFSTYDEVELRRFDLQLELFKVERLLEDEYLPINTQPIFNNPDVYFNSETGLLDQIVYQTRKKLSERHDLSKASLAKCCIDTSSYLEKVCSKLGVEFISIGINQSLEHGIFHHFTIIKIPQDDGSHKLYLTDCTYRQFFTMNNSNPHRIGVMRGPVAGCSIGAYMMMNENRRNIAETILSNGYIELTPEVFKEYFDSIIYSSRSKDYYDANGLDYLNSDDVIPSFSADDYLEVLHINGVIDDNTFSFLKSEIGSKDMQRNT